MGLIIIFLVLALLFGIGGAIKGVLALLLIGAGFLLLGCWHIWRGWWY